MSNVPSHPAPSVDAGVKAAARILCSADAVLVTCGAGLGVDSGLPDFRGTKGFWAAYPQAEALGLNFAELANPRWFERDPCLAWGFFGHRYNAYATAIPHAGYEMLRDFIAGQKGGNGFVYTTNVDGGACSCGATQQEFEAAHLTTPAVRAAWRKAGFPADRIHEAHGSIHHLQCSAPEKCCAGRWVSKVRRFAPAEGLFPVDPVSLRVAEAALPRCPHGCGALARPNVYMFDDETWVSHRADEQECRYDRWLLGVAAAGQRLAVIDIGSGTVLPTAREMAEAVALHGGGATITTRAADGGPGLKIAGFIRINPMDPQIPSAGEGSICPETVEIAAGALAALSGIQREVDALASEAARH